MGLFDWLRPKQSNRPDAELTKLEYLNRYSGRRGEVVIVEEPVPADAPIPQAWRALAELEANGRVELMLGLMREVVGEQLPTTLAYFEENCTDAELARLGDRYVVIYTVISERKKHAYLCGGNPLQPTWLDRDSSSEPNVREVWDLVPEPLKTFYETVHDGFARFEFGHLGLAPLSDVTCFAEDLDVDEQRQRYAGAYGFCYYPSGVDCVVLDINGPQPGRADLFWHDDESELDIDFWAEVDETITRSLMPYPD